jgi:hypothetical protein
MCLNEKLSFNIKIKSRNCELFVLKKNDFLRLSVNFKEFIENFLHKSLMIYLKFSEEKKKIMREEEARMNRNLAGDKNKKNDQKADLEIVNEEKEDADMSEYDINSDYESEKSQTSSEKEDKEHEEKESKAKVKELMSINNIGNIQEQVTVNKKELDNNPDIRRGSVKRLSVAETEKKYNSEQENASGSAGDSENDPLDKMKNEINKKFIKKIDKILQYLESNSINFDSMENNPKLLLKQLKTEGNILEKNNIIDKIENILKEFYTQHAK